MSKETINLDPRLVGVDIHNAWAVCEALGGYKSFDVKAYLTLPIGKRLLTEEELASLSEKDRKPIPDNLDDPFYLAYFSKGVTEGNGGVSDYDYNWDPKERKLVYEDDVPDEMVYAMQEIRGEKCESLDENFWRAANSANNSYNK